MEEEEGHKAPLANCATGKKKKKMKQAGKTPHPGRTLASAPTWAAVTRQ